MGIESTHRQRDSLRVRLLLAFVGLALVPLFGSNAIGYWKARRILVDHAEANLAAVADIQADHVEERLDQRRLYLEAIATGNRFLEAAAHRFAGAGGDAMAAAATPTEVTAYLRRKLQESERFDALALFTPQGRLIASTDDQAPVSAWPPQAGAGVVLLRPLGNEAPPVLRLASPVREDGGDVVAVLAGSVPLAHGVEFLDIPQHVAGSIESFIVDGRGRPIFVSHPHGHVEYGQRLASPAVRLPPGVLSRYRDREGVDVIGTSAELPTYGWTFVTEVPLDDVLGDLRSLRALSLLLGGIFAPLVLLAAWLMAGGIAAPVGRLVDAARRVGGGDLEARVPVGGPPEVAALGTAFNDMAAELARSQERIRRLHEQEIARAEQLATVGELASGIAHEIKNPMVGISNGMDLILRRVKGDAALEPIAEEMHRQTRRIESAVRDLLAYARPAEPVLGPVAARAVAERALNLVRPHAHRQGVRVAAVVDGDVPTLHADADQLGQAVVNLLLNAVEFSPDGSEVLLSVRQKESGVAITVEDEGPGVPEEVRDRLFRPFFTTRHSGTGLGLSITRGIVERHGGRISVGASARGGAAFSMWLPLSTPADPNGAGEAP